MGYHKDLGTGVVHDVCPITGYPRDQWGHLLDPHEDRRELRLGIFEVGQELYNLTNPYGHLHFGIGDDDTFLCMDYQTIVVDGGKTFLIVDGTFNTESGGYIGNAFYEIIPVNSDKERQTALNIVRQIVSYSVPDDTPHDPAGWNQEEDYFVRAVENHLFDRGWNDEDMRWRNRGLAKQVEVQ